MNTTIFTGAVDMVEYFDSTNPCPSYTGLYDRWYENLIESVNEHLAVNEIETTSADIETAITFVGNIVNMFSLAATSSRWAEQTVEQRLEHLNSIIARPNIPQRTPAWYEQSRNVLTASEFSAILGTERALATLAVQKSQIPPQEGNTHSRHACATSEMGPMDWGVRFEPVVKQILKKMWGATILDIGRLMHPTDPHLAASPDGLMMAADDSMRVGRLIEIKCPIRRAITGKIPFEYWCQMQIQMEVTDIDECDYIEVKLASPYRGDIEPYKASDSSLYSGKIWLFQDSNTLELKYAYTDAEKLAFEAANFNPIEEIPWHLDTYYAEVVARDRAWFKSTEERRSEFWKKVDEIKEGSFVLPRKEKGITVTVCKITDD